MANAPAETEYEVIRLRDGRWGVRITAPDALPRVTEGFATEAEAEAWAFQQAEASTGNQGLPPLL